MNKLKIKSKQETEELVRRTSSYEQSIDLIQRLKKKKKHTTRIKSTENSSSRGIG